MSESITQDTSGRGGICLVSSCGGHLEELRMLRPAFSDYRYFYVVNDRIELSRDMVGRTYFIEHVERSWRQVINLVEATHILRRERPEVILSTGAGPAVPFAIIGKLIGVPSIYVESACRIESCSLTGRIMYWLADEMFVQWPKLLNDMPRAQIEGSVLELATFRLAGHRDGNESEQAKSIVSVRGKYILISVGNFREGFDRLLNWADGLLEDKRLLAEEVVVQSGHSRGTCSQRLREAGCRVESFFPRREFKRLVEHASAVVSHGGIGTVIDAISSGTPLVVVPREKKLGEVVDDHQRELCKLLEETKAAKIARTRVELRDALAGEELSDWSVGVLAEGGEETDLAAAVERSLRLVGLK